ncbi:hypothetical protein GCM10008957_20700 [Deinococcus ruber]|uniref:Sucrose phosphatase-like domain-containing protein n=1 Tax=Deinococcus ruber TaxID=1848197 RepID=A0A918C5M5_9DEIO|nr:hypothetical protein GCM10008957_20700 [Deinococcus ruber]
MTLPFTSWRVLDHGLTILTPQGEPEPQWTGQASGHLHSLRQTLEDGTAHILPHAQRLGCRLTRHTAHELPFMSVLKHPDADPHALAEVQRHWEEWLTQTGGAALQVIANANNVSLLPASLGKAQAVMYLRRTYFSDAALVLGLGDSLSDVPFLNACDFALTPPGGQLLRSVTAARLPQR